MAFHLGTPLTAAIAISVSLGAPAQQPAAAQDKPQLEQATHWRLRKEALRSAGRSPRDVAGSPP